MADTTHGLDLSSDENARKSRKGSIPRNVDTYLKSAMLEAFQDELMKLSDGEVPTKVKAKHLGQAALLGGTTAPLVGATGDFVKGFAKGQGGILSRAASGVGEVSHELVPSLAARATTGALGMTGVVAARHALEQRQAYELARAKQADMLGSMGAPSGPKISTPAAPTLGVLRGSSNKSQRVGNTPIAAKSGVTRSASGQAMNPRANLSDAMRPKV